MNSRRRLRHRLEVFLYVIGFAAIGLWGIAHLSSQLYQARQLRLFAEHVAAAGGAARDGSPDAAGPITVPRPIEPRAPLGRLDIDRLDLSVAMSEGVDRLTLLRAAGHIPASPLPGEPGNVVIAGHRDTFFRPLENIAVDDTVRVTTDYGAFLYRVVSTEIVRPTQTEVLQDGPEPTLTLVTCYPFRYVGRAPQRFIVTARQIDPAPAPAATEQTYRTTRTRAEEPPARPALQRTKYAPAGTDRPS